MPRRAPRAIPGGTTIYVGPLRIYINGNRDGLCSTFVFYGTKGTLGHQWNVEESILLELKEEMDEPGSTSS